MSRLSWFLAAAIALVIGNIVRDIIADADGNVAATASAPIKVGESASMIAAKIKTTDTAEMNKGFSENIPAVVAANSSEMTSDNILQWAMATASEDKHTQDTAYAALINAPRETVLPVLQSVMTNGSESGRQLALNALHMLALKQGDAKGEIQNILRLATYDGDTAFAPVAQLALEDIERVANSSAPELPQPTYR